MNALFKKNTKSIGNDAERHAENHLKQQGLKLKKRNFHSRFGEIDLIMTDRDNTLVFIEVRSRQSNAQVSAAESISAGKIQKIRKTAHVYLANYPEMPNCRFDVIAMTHNLYQDDYTIDWIQNAF